VLSDNAAPQTVGFPTHVAELYKPLWRQVAWLFAKWQTYPRLFGTSEDDIKVLNRAAGSFAALIQNVLVGDLLLTASRLTDPKGSGLRTNLSLETLVHAIETDKYAQLREEAEEQLADAYAKTSFAREWRNRQIAHLDLRTELRSCADSLSPYTRGQVQDALDAIAAVLNTLNAAFSGSTTFFGDFIDGPGTAGALIKHLRNGLELQEWGRNDKAKGGTGILPG
jgi:hypothetical protein